MSRRRLLYAAAAVFVAAVTVMVPTQPAQAAPGQCTMQEWRDRSKWGDCTSRAKEQIGEALPCVGADAPTPGSPTSGMPGFFTTRPDSSLRSGVAGPPNGNPSYSEYGVGGFGLDTYNMGCLGTAQHPDLIFWNNAAETEFMLAASIMGAANGLRQVAYDPGSVWGWADGFLKASTDAIYNYVFSKVGVLMFVVIGSFIVWRSKNGEMSETMKVATWAIVVLVATIALARWPVQAAHGTDAVGSGAIALAHKAVGQGPEHIPADKCVLGPEACIDHRTPAVRVSDTVTEAILYRSWLRAVLGSADGPTAETYGPILYDATTLRWEEAARVTDNPNTRQGLLDQKAQQWNTAAEQIRQTDPEAYEHLQGVHGSARFGAGLVAVLSALAYSAFDIVASIIILFGFALLRVAVILFPLLATLGVFYYASSPMRRVIHMSGAALFNVTIFGFGSAIYTAGCTLLFRSSLNGYVQVFLVALFGGVAWVALRPVRKLVHTATGRSRTEPSATSRAVTFVKDEYAAQQAQGQPDATAGPGAGEPVTDRPENTPSTKRRLLEAAAPSIATGLGHPEVAAAIGVVNKVRNHTRPEAATTPVSAPAGAAAAAPTSPAPTMAAAGRPESRS